MAIKVSEQEWMARQEFKLSEDYKSRIANTSSKDLQKELVRLLEEHLDLVEELQGRGYEVSIFLGQNYKNQVTENCFKVICKKELK